MLHLECIFTLPDAPASWTEGDDGESVRETIDRLVAMDEESLAVAAISPTPEFRANAGRMSEQEEGEWGREVREREEDFISEP